LATRSTTSATAGESGIRGDAERGYLSPNANAYETNAALAAALNAGELDLAGGTTWLWCREDMVGSLDVLVVDEAGQSSPANALAASSAASNVILVGDPLQLGQPSQASHPRTDPG